MVYSNNENQKSPAKRFLFILGLLMPFIYVFLGVSVIFLNGLKYFNLQLTRTNELLFGSFLIAYAVFRLVRFYLSLKREEEE